MCSGNLRTDKKTIGWSIVTQDFYKGLSSRSFEAIKIDGDADLL